MRGTKVRAVAPGKSSGAIGNNGRWSEGAEGEAGQGRGRGEAGARQGGQEWTAGRDALLHNKAGSANR